MVKETGAAETGAARSDARKPAFEAGALVKETGAEDGDDVKERMSAVEDDDAQVSAGACEKSAAQESALEAGARGYDAHWSSTELGVESGLEAVDSDSARHLAFTWVGHGEARARQLLARGEEGVAREERTGCGLECPG